MLAGMLLLTLVLFRLYQRELASHWLDLAAHPQIMALLEDGASDLKRLAEFDPDGSSAYRQRFEELQQARRSLSVLNVSRPQMARRFEWFLLIGLGAILVCAALLHWVEHRRKARRLALLRQPLQELASGQEKVSVTVHGSDTVSQMARMIEKTAAVISGQRERLQYLRHLRDWQDAARRWGHELRTPLTTIYLEMNRTTPLIADLPRAQNAALNHIIESVLEEVGRLKDFANSFSSFAGMSQPRLGTWDLNAYLEHFCELFAEAWQGVQLKVEPASEPIKAAFDKSMIRQVVMNLCNNSVHAFENHQGVLRFRCGVEGTRPFLDVMDNGPGIPESLGTRIFEPYVTTRKMGKGMGLGLAISRKIMLEHQGDLRLVKTGPAGSCFRLLFGSVGNDGDNQTKEQGV